MKYRLTHNPASRILILESEDANMKNTMRWVGIPIRFALALVATPFVVLVAVIDPEESDVIAGLWVWVYNPLGER